MNPRNEKTVRLLFLLSIIGKGIFAATEIVGGVALLFFNTGIINFLTRFLTSFEISEDSNDFLANYLLRSAQALTHGTQTFAALYLLSHGIVKIFIVYNLLKNRMWAYPAALVVFALFIAYQLYRFSYTHSIFLILLTIFDLGVMWLVWKEYSIVKKGKEA